MKYGGIVTAIGFGVMLLSNVLLRLGAPRILAQILVIAGAVLFFCGLLGIIVYADRHPPLRCPACGKGLRSRHLRKPGGGLRLTGQENVQCPFCGAMFLPQMLYRDLK